ncbi:hypothetical protein LOK49_LG10G00617 [Camellia lanceoleosa]|uniref:Uncharacterized protein n=1 Tax=Camellia lanceoleosa TaxID=1840588 RepID=A0ACC0G9A8_9ERIC|nr:hypothetical protein LOK49_LG10G00617 [Camellia lanceoleosa]
MPSFRKLSSLVSRLLRFVHEFVQFHDFAMKFGSHFLDFFVPATTYTVVQSIGIGFADFFQVFKVSFPLYSTVSI